MASLNVKGRGSSSPLHPNNKWNALHHFIKERKLAILAVQETHLDDECVNRLAELYGRRLAIYASHGDNPTASQGVAIIINRDLVNVDEVTATEIIPGRAILVEIPWHEDKWLRVVNVYAPNDSQKNANFWKAIDTEWSTRNLPKPDIMLGDFNITEEVMDRLPQRNDDHPPVEALQNLTNRFGLLDGWRSTNPSTLEFSFPVLHRDSKSRLDRIYASQKIVRLAEQWTIETSQINTDHRMVTTRITDLKAPFLGLGRWAMPVDIIKDKLFVKIVNEETVKLKKAIRSCTIRTAANNPQILFYNYKEKMVKAARDRAKTKVPKVRMALQGLQSELERIKENPNTNTSESLQTTL